MSRPDVRQFERMFRSPDRRFAPDEIALWNLGEFVKSGLVVRAELWDEYPCEGLEMPMPLNPNPDGTYYCFTTTGRMNLTRDEIQTWKVDPAAFAEMLHGLFDCRGEMEETVPGVMWNLGPSRETLGRTAMRDVYFITRIGSSKAEALDRLPKDAKSYIALVGSIDEWIELGKEMSKHVFPLFKVTEADERGEWKIIRERINLNFAPENKPGPRPSNKGCDEKKQKIAKFFFDLCFALRNDYDALCAERKKYKTGESLAKALELDKSDISRIVGDAAVRKGTADPCASFWRKTFMEDEAFNVFDEWVRMTNVGEKQKLGAGLLKEEIVKYAAQKLAKAAMRSSR